MDEARKLTTVEVDMGIRQLSSGRHRARVMIEGRNYTATFDTRAQAAEWELVTRAKASQVPCRGT